MRFVASPYYQDRHGHPIKGIVIHTTVGSYDGTIAYFQNNKDQVSSHYVVSLEGDVTQMVEDVKAANHAGVIDRPSFKMVKDQTSINPNFYLLGIENADDKNPSGADRIKQYPALISLVRDLCLKHDIPIDREHICGHREIRASKTCPGNLDVDFIVREAQKGVQANEFGLLVKKSTQWDETVKTYLPDKQPEHALFDDLQRFIGGIKSRITDLENQLKDKLKQLADALAEVSNRTEQVSRLKVQLTELEKQKDIEISSYSEQVKMVPLLRGQLEAKQKDINDIYKRVGDLERALAVAQAGVPIEKKVIYLIDLKIIYELLNRLIAIVKRK